MKRCARRVLVNRIQINLIDEHERADAACDITDFTQYRLRSKRTRRIMKICDHDEAGLRRNTTKNLLRVHSPAVFSSTLKALHVRLQVTGYIENGPVCRMLD